MKLGLNTSQPDITTLQLIDNGNAGVTLLTDLLWEESLQEVLQDNGVGFVARQLRSISWLDRSRLPDFVFENSYRELMKSVASASSIDDTSVDAGTDILVAMQAVYGLSVEDMRIDLNKLIEGYAYLLSATDGRIKIAKHTLAANMRILGINLSIPDELLPLQIEIMRSEIENTINSDSYTYLINMFVMMRILFPDYFRTWNLHKFGFDDPVEFMQKIENVPGHDYLAIAAGLRFINAAEIIYKPTGVKIIDKMEGPRDIGEVLPIQKIF